MGEMKICREFDIAEIEEIMRDAPESFRVPQSAPGD